MATSEPTILTLMADLMREAYAERYIDIHRAWEE